MEDKIIKLIAHFEEKKEINIQGWLEPCSEGVRPNNLVRGGEAAGFDYCINKLKEMIIQHNSGH